MAKASQLQVIDPNPPEAKADTAALEEVCLAALKALRCAMQAVKKTNVEKKEIRQQLTPRLHVLREQLSRQGKKGGG